jgi:hypothetical protein
MSTITLRSPEDGSEATITLGWSWSLFFGGGFFGMTLFMRGLHSLGVFFLLLAYAHWFLSQGADTPMRLVYLAIHLALVAWIAFRGNALTAHMLIKHGWTVVRPREHGLPAGAALNRIAA